MNQRTRDQDRVPRLRPGTFALLATVALGPLYACAANGISEWETRNPAIRVTHEVSMENIPEPLSASEISYPGASATNAFVAREPYMINIMGVLTPSRTYGFPRANDFGGTTPFVDPASGASHPGVFQGWDATARVSRNIVGKDIDNRGFPGRIEKRNGYTMVRYNAGDDITAGKARTQLVSYAVPPRTHVRWDLAVSFGAKDGENDWTMSKPGASPVLFWQLKSASGVNPSMAATVDTDPEDPERSLMLTFAQKGGKATVHRAIARVHGIPRYTIIPIVIEAYLDEREIEEGGKGRERIWVGDTQVADVIGPTLVWGPGEHKWMLNMYLYNEPQPYQFTRASFWKAARLIVFP